MHSSSAPQLYKRLRRKFPNRILAVELTNSCNLHCPLCSTGSGFNKKPKGMMRFEDFKRVMDECAFLVDQVNLTGSGEPFLHPEILRFVRYCAKEQRKKVSCCSNGMLLTDSEEIVKSGLRAMYVDIDGVTQSQHEKYRVGSDLNKILSNVKKLIQAKKLLRSRYPEVYLDTLISRYNENEHEKFITLARQAGCNGIQLNVIYDDIYKTEDWFPVQKKFRPVPRQSDRFACFFKYFWSGILSWDGEVQLCCMSPNLPDSVIKLDAFKTDTILEALDSEEFYKLTKSAGEYPFCKTCSYAGYFHYTEFVTFDSFLRRGMSTCMDRPIGLLKKIVWKRRAPIPKSVV